MNVPLILSMSILLLPSIRKHKSILDATAALKNIRILRGIIAFTHDIRRTQSELRGQRSLARPLDIVFVVVGSAVGAAHYVHIVETACVAADAC